MKIQITAELSQSRLFMFKFLILQIALVMSPASYAATVKIMPLGDSITEGYYACSYRKPLVESLESCDFQMVGDQVDAYNPENECLQSNENHMGFSGWQTTNFLSDNGSGETNISSYISDHVPDVVLLHIGSNDMYYARPVGVYDPETLSGTETIGRVNTMIDTIYEEQPDATIFVANLIPWFSDSVVNDGIDLLRVETTVLVNARSAAGDDIHLVNVNAEFTSDMMHDGVHPNETGESLIASRFKTALQENGICDSVTDVNPSIVSPIPGSTLGSTEVELQWSNGTFSVAEWWLYLGSSMGKRDLFDSGSIAPETYSSTVTNLPENGGNIYAKLWYRERGALNWQFVEHIFTASGEPLEITSHANGSSLAGSIETISWNAVADEYWVYVGSSLGASDFYDSKSIGSATSLTISGLPADGISPVFVRLWYSNSNGSWQFIDRQYIAGTSGEIAMSPDPESFTISSSTVTFDWQNSDLSVTRWWLYAGTSKGARDINDSGNLGLATTHTVDDIELGGTVFIRLWYQIGPGTPWYFTDFTYNSINN